MNLPYTIIDKITGAIKRTGTCPDIVYQYQCQADEMIMTGYHNDLEFYYDVVNHVMIAIPPAPTTFHRWNPESKTWVETRTADGTRAIQEKAIEAEREARIAAPILFDGVMVDADDKSQRNIVNKIDEIRDLTSLGEPGLAPEECVWRLADNSMWQAIDEAAYQTWLTQLAVVIRKRGTQAYTWSWAKKGELLALGDDLSALLAFDPTSD